MMAARFPVTFPLPTYSRERQEALRVVAGDPGSSAEALYDAAIHWPRLVLSNPVLVLLAIEDLTAYEEINGRCWRQLQEEQRPGSTPMPGRPFALKL
jgi:hypothetical protein